MVADGGDFDAANPGAAKEADRMYLLYFSCIMPPFLFYKTSN